MHTRTSWGIAIDVDAPRHCRGKELTNAVTCLHQPRPTKSEIKAAFPAKTCKIEREGGDYDIGSLTVRPEPSQTPKQLCRYRKIQLIAIGRLRANIRCLQVWQRNRLE